MHLFPSLLILSTLLVNSVLGINSSDIDETLQIINTVRKSLNDNNLQLAAQNQLNAVSQKTFATDPTLQGQSLFPTVIDATNLGDAIRQAFNQYLNIPNKETDEIYCGDWKNLAQIVYPKTTEIGVAYTTIQNGKTNQFKAIAVSFPASPTAAPCGCSQSGT
ncbi:hypothetical protein F5884DRAFT_839107 [Xylogone sp. PMI_703]|nr:hypothetical protein F5884DRAFT_839107 [Xylogone sp. PMI_703]